MQTFGSVSQSMLSAGRFLAPSDGTGSVPSRRRFLYTSGIVGSMTRRRTSILPVILWQVSLLWCRSASMKSSGLLLRDESVCTFISGHFSLVFWWVPSCPITAAGLSARLPPAGCRSDCRFATGGWSAGSGNDDMAWRWNDPNGVCKTSSLFFELTDSCWVTTDWWGLLGRLPGMPSEVSVIGLPLCATGTGYGCTGYSPCNDDRCG